MDHKTAPVVLVDGSSYLYRAFHALPMLTTSSGQHTGAIKGVISMLLRLIKDYPQSPMAVVFDAKGKTFRDDIFADYKAHRPPMPDELRTQVEPIHRIIEALGLPLLVIEGVEADDVIGTLAREASAKQMPVVVSTGDKDMAQLVDDNVTLVNTMTDTRLDPVGVQEKFGIPPHLMIDLLALMGDKVDNIPGVPGIGEKTALALLQGVGGIDALYANPDAIAALPVRGAKTLATKLLENKDNAYLSYQLATIKTDVALDVHVDEFARKPLDKDTLMRWYRELEFKTWLSELLTESSSGAAGDDPAPAGSAAQATTQRDYYTITEQTDFDHWLSRLQKAELFAFDTETTSLDYMQAQIVGVSFAIEPGIAAYVPLAHDYVGAPDQLNREHVLAALKPLLEDAGKLKIGQNPKYDMSVLANHGITLRGVAFDTMLESYVLDSTATRHDMDSLALKYLGENTIHFEDIAGTGQKQLTFNQIAVEQAGPYAAEDADITLRLHQRLWPELSRHEKLKSVFTDIEMPLVPVLSRIERRGARVDVAMLKKQSGELGHRIEALEKEAHVLAGGPFNLGSPKQLQEILFEQHKLPVLKKTPKGQPSTAEEVLAELALDYPLPRVIMDYRSLSKLKSTYTDRLPERVDPNTGRVHTSYHQAVAATGRLSSTDPNLQNIPIRTEEGRRIRKAFVASPGYKIVAADYSQIELRIMAHLSGDASLLHAFANGIDVHRATAAEVFAVPLDNVTSDMRRSAKAINFGLIYGMSAFGLGRQLNIGRNDAQAYIDRYFERYPGVHRYMEDTRRLAHEQGYVETLFGRRLHLPEINAANKTRQQAAERTAINAPMQGTAADIIKRAMIAVDAWLQQSRIDAAMIMQVHDELVFEVAESAVDELVANARQHMESAAELSVALEVGVGIGANWDEAH